MTEDIWDEKPKSVKVYEQYADDYYHVEEMDAWLEKLKDARLNEWVLICRRHYSNLNEKIQELQETADKYDELAESIPLTQHLTFEQVVNEHKTLSDKLEAIKNWINTQPKCIRGSLKLKELEEILGVEE